ncbi:MAG: flavin reductase family protein [Candidatus Lokiarchaeota archaeon]|nr:flavin reductase family protein [Candidatus Lokiarchaeota archaeon]
MTKVTLSKGTTTFPMPAAVISVGVGGDANLITLAYVGKVCLNPPIIAIGINTKRHSFKLIEEHDEFVINYPNIDQLKEMDYCGTRSGRDVNKWEQLGLTKEKGKVVQVPLVKEFPWNMECKVVNRLELGSHVCFFGEVVAVHCDKKYLKNDSIDPDKLDTFAYISGNYVELKTGALGSHGFSFK